MKSDAEMVAEFLAKGGKVTHCPPGPSDHVTYRNNRYGRPRRGGPEGAEKPAAAATAAKEGG